MAHECTSGRSDGDFLVISVCSAVVFSVLPALGCHRLPSGQRGHRSHELESNLLISKQALPAFPSASHVSSSSAYYSAQCSVTSDHFPFLPLALHTKRAPGPAQRGQTGHREVAFYLGKGYKLLLLGLLEKPDEKLANKPVQ